MTQAYPLQWPTGCPRQITDHVKADAERWWQGPNPPIAVADFHHSCPQYVPANRV